MKRIHLIALSALAALCISCYENIIDDTDPNMESTQYFTKNYDIDILKDKTIEFIQQPGEDNSSIIFDGSTPEEALPKEGSKIYIPASEQLPYGFLGKVSHIERGSQIVVHTETVALDEVFDYLAIDTTFQVINEFEGVFDEEGNPIDFEFVNIEDVDLNDTEIEPSTKSHDGLYWDWDWSNQSLKFPVNLYTGSSGKNKIEIQGIAYVGFRKFDFDLDIANKSLKYLNVDAVPYIQIGASSTVSTSKKLEASKRLGQFRFRITIITPVIPIIIPVTVYIYGNCGITGELSATLGLQYEYNCNCKISYRNKQFNSDVIPGNLSNKSPWTVGQFDVNGEIHTGVKFGVIAGLYSATTGIGFNVIPNLSLGANASLSSTDLLKTNPSVNMNLKVGSEVYCAAELFGMQLAKYTLEFPEFVLWSQSIKLLPEINHFTAVGHSSTADISWDHDRLYFLAPLGVGTGTTVFKSDLSPVASYRPAPSNHTSSLINSYAVNATGLEGGKTYYAAPFAYWGQYQWYGDMTEFTTEASYNLGFRCSSQSYDVISFSFSLNDTYENVIDYTTEAQDYDGSPMRVHILGQYNASTQTLDGIFDFYFYNDPGQQRIDGFSVSLATNDSGYVECNKVIDNGGCYASLRIYKSTDAAAAAKRYNKAVSDRKCSEGFYNNNYQ